MHIRKNGAGLLARIGRPALLTSVALGALAVTPAAQAVVPNDTKTPTQILDSGVNGVGIMYRADGFVCTGTLINPRTVIFAAHCVNDKNPATYSTVNSGGTPVAFAFQADARPGLVNWLNNNYRTNTALSVYNVNNIAYNPESLDPRALSFLFGDVAMATLDTPAKGVPTWTMLFSALPAPSSISNTTGTNYHVTMTGYGRTGSGTLGQNIAVDFRRRVAENFIGMLGSLDDVDSFLFGSADGYQQNLYHTDFDDPANRNPYDFNLFKDDALPNEASTASGDSGGPLILDRTFTEKTVIGVLSGGSRYFLGQPQSSYGGSSFYQPLYLFWDWIATNNPYRYATAKAGDGKWSDASHWVTALDPNYRIIDNTGKLVNGVPTTTGAGSYGADAAKKFGQFCYQPTDGSDNTCYDVNTKQLIVNGRVVSDDGAVAADSGIVSKVGNNLAKVEIADREATPEAVSLDAQAAETQATAAVRAGQPDGSFTEAQASVPVGAPTLANGLPGASNFVPNNVAPVASRGVVGRYYDVTLTAAGRTTLDTAATVDRFGIAGTGAILDVTSTGSLTSLMEISQLAGTVNVNGTVTTPGDYFLMTGLLSGTGTVRAPFLTNVMGTIAPGGIGTVGTLTIEGNAILASGSTLAIDLGANGVSDVLAVRGTGAGAANVGGNLVFAPTSGTRLRFGNRYTVLTATGGVTGTFRTPSALTPILRPVLSYSANAVSVTIDAGRYIDVVNGASQTQLSFARLLDQNRGLYSRFAGLYGETDLMTVAGIQAAFEAMAPRTEALRTSMGETLNDNMARFYRDRLTKLDGGAMGGTLTMVGQPIQLAAASLNNIDLGMDQGGADSTTREGVLPDDVSAFLAGGYIDGSSAPMRAIAPLARNQFDGWYAAAGVEKAFNDDGVVGLSVAFSQLKGNTAVGDYNRARLYQGTVYGAFDLGGLKLDAVGSAGTLASKSRRAFAVGTTPYTLFGSDQQLALSGEMGLSKALGTDAFAIVPRASIRGAYISGGNLAEYGGDAALVIQRKAVQSAQGRLGATVKANTGGLRPYVTANYVHEFRDQPAFVLANLVGGTGPLAPFALGGQDKNWGEIGGGLTIATGTVDLSLSADTTAWRKDVKYQSYRASMKIRF
jgi:hypothetical protein